jgi:oligoendopeptidase F
MTMELITMDHWDVFFDDKDELRRARQQHLEQVISTLPWVANIDHFQHWIYENPQAGQDELQRAWLEMLDAYSDDVTDWQGLENNKAYLWQKQLHLYEVPFYYIEYGFAQLGAIAIWKNYKENPNAALEAYLNALRLGNTRTIPEIYEAAGIRFDFSRTYIRELIAFVRKEWEALV